MSNRTIESLEASETLRNRVTALQAERDDLKAALVEARGDTYPQPKKGWQCFHCGEWFTTSDSAKSHFGESPESFTELSNLLEEHRQQYADKCLEVIALQAENEKLYEQIKLNERHFSVCGNPTAR